MSAPQDPIEQLRAATKRALERQQYRVSVSPQALSWLLRRYDALADVTDEPDQPGVEHSHVTDPRWDEGRPPTYLVHTHKRGDVPHGHHGWRFQRVGRVPLPSDPRPRVEL